MLKKRGRLAHSPCGKDNIILRAVSAKHNMIYQCDHHSRGLIFFLCFLETNVDSLIAIYLERGLDR